MENITVRDIYALEYVHVMWYSQPTRESRTGRLRIFSSIISLEHIKNKV